MCRAPVAQLVERMTSMVLLKSGSILGIMRSSVQVWPRASPFLQKVKKLENSICTTDVFYLER